MLPGHHLQRGEAVAQAVGRKALPIQPDQFEKMVELVMKLGNDNGVAVPTRKHEIVVVPGRAQ